MTKIRTIFDTIDTRIAKWMNKHGQLFLRISMGIIFIWFGLLKVFGHSPANNLISHTVYWFDPNIFIPILGLWEAAIGFCFLFKNLTRLAIFLLFLQIGGTFLPLILLPDVCYKHHNILLLTLEGQYIVKNLLIISAAIVIGGNVRVK